MLLRAGLWYAVPFAASLGITQLFGSIRIAYFAVAVIPAVLGTRWLRSSFQTPRRGFSLLRPALALAAFAPAAICLHSSFIAPYRMQTERVTCGISGLSRTAPLKVVILADIQTDRVTDYERGAIDSAMAEQPDLILIPGDLLQCSRQRRPAVAPQFTELLARLRAPLGVFAVLGDVDAPEGTRQLLQGTSARLLVNEVVTIAHAGRKIAIGGVELRCWSDAARATIRELQHTSADVRLLMAHRPDAVFEIAARPADRPSAPPDPHPGQTPLPDGRGFDFDAKIDLVVAGHTHGGQFVIPGFGPPLTLSRVPRAVAAGGLHVVSGAQIYVSRGIGHERGLAPPLRFNCPPELTVLTLTAAQ